MVKLDYLDYFLYFVTFVTFPQSAVHQKIISHREIPETSYWDQTFFYKATNVSHNQTVFNTELIEEAESTIN